MSTVIKIKTWRCPTCDYAQDFDPDDKILMALHFPSYPVGNCPACHSGQNPTGIKSEVKMVKETRPEKKTTISIKDEASVDTEVDQDESILLVSKPAEKDKRKQAIRDAIIKFRLLEDSD